MILILIILTLLFIGISALVFNFLFLGNNPIGLIPVIYIGAACLHTALTFHKASYIFYDNNEKIKDFQFLRNFILGLVFSDLLLLLTTHFVNHINSIENYTSKELFDFAMFLVSLNFSPMSIIIISAKLFLLYVVFDSIKKLKHEQKMIKGL